jgi:hypothetical protein
MERPRVVVPHHRRPQPDTPACTQAPSGGHLTFVLSTNLGFECRGRCVVTMRSHANTAPQVICDSVRCHVYNTASPAFSYDSYWQQNLAAWVLGRKFLTVVAAGCQADFFTAAERHTWDLSPSEDRRWTRRFHTMDRSPESGAPRGSGWPMLTS